MMYEEVWVKTRCPECKNCNWICEGDLTDCTAPDTEAIECCSCSHKWWRDIDTARDMYYIYDENADEDVDDDEYPLAERLNDYAVKGREKPR